MIRLRGSLAAALLVAQLAHAEEAGRGALAIGAATLSGAPGDLSTTGLHIGWESAYHFGWVGPMVSLSFDRFTATTAGSPPNTFVSMGAGLRGFLLELPLTSMAIFFDAQGVVLGSPVPIGTTSTFFGGAGGVGVEWAAGLSFALAARYISLIDGPSLLSLSLVIGLGAP